MISVKLPDGSTAQFPDGTPKETMQAAIAKKFPPQSATLPEGIRPFGNANWQPKQPERPNLLNSTLATVNGLAASVPFLQQTTDAIGGGIAQLMGGNYNDYIAHQKQVRDDLAKAAPVSRFLGQLGGTMAGVGALGATKAGAESLGLSGSFGKQILNSALSGAGLSGVQGISEGKRGAALLGDMGLGAAGGAIGSAVGQGVSAAGNKIASAFTGMLQRNATARAVMGAPSSGEIKNAASELFERATGGSAPIISDNAYFRFLGGVKQVADKFRINAANDPKAVGLLQTLMQIADETSSGAVVDMKDLHLLRQLAQKVAQSSEGRDKAIGTAVISQLDDFVRGLKPTDILGGGDPKLAADSLMQGIGLWSRANKVALVEEAVRNAETYKSSLENGLKLSFLKLMRDPAFDKFTLAEKAAIRDVAYGTAKQNIAGLLGAFGLNITGPSGRNIIGAGAGTTALTTMLAPFLGPAALPAAATITTGTGMVGRKIAEDTAVSGANRAVQAMATPNIPVVNPIPNFALPAKLPIELLIRGGAMTAN